MAKYNGPSFVIEFPMNPHEYDRLKLENIFDISRVFYNQLVSETLKRYEQLKQDKRYQKNERCIKGISKKINSLEKKIQSEKNKHLRKEVTIQLKEKEKERKELYEIKTDLMKEFGYAEFILHSVATELNHYYTRIDSNTAQKLATRAFQAVEKIRKGKAKRVYFKKLGSMTSIEGKTNKSGILFRKEKEGYVVKFQGMVIPVSIKENDNYAHEALSCFSTISYCRLVRRFIRGKIRFFVQLTIKGVPPKKENRKLGKGIVSIDPSLQMMAIVSHYRALCIELAPTIQNIQDKIRLLQRKLQRSRQAMNPNKFNDDGTINRKNNDPWVRSHNYMKLVFQLKELHRKQAAIRKLSHNRLSNLILRMGNIFKIEKNHFKAFQKRKKKTVKKKGKFLSKKRFGKSIANKAPSLFLTMLKNKVLFLGGKYIEIDPRKAKPSQYDHQTNEYKKKKLSERWHVFQDGTRIQRDLYSAFLIGCADEETHLINHEECIKCFQSFKKMHAIEIQRMKQSSRILSAFGV